MSSAAARVVVYVEDNPANLRLVQRILERQGAYRVVGVPTAGEAVAALDRERPALLLLDLDLPDRRGEDLLAELRATPRFSTLPILIVSASVMQHERERCLASGAQGFIEKPFELGEFRRQVDALASLGAP